jgi:hypothetical protein
MKNQGTRPKKKVNEVQRPAPIQVRLPKGALENLDKKAVETGLTRHALVVSAVEASLAAPTARLPDALVYGWANPGGAKALGDALGKLAGQIEDNGPGQRELDHADRLAMFRVAVVWVLNQLGANVNLSTEQTTFAQLAARQFMNDFQHVEPNPAAYSQRSDLAVMASLAASFSTKTDDHNRRE